MTYELKRIQPKHEQIADLLIANPGISGRELARLCNCTPQTIYNILNSDAFRQYLEKRRRDALPHLTTLYQRTAAAAQAAVEKLAAEIDRSEDPLFILDAADKLLSKLYRAAPSTSVQVNAGSSAVQVNVLSAEDLERARERVRALLTPAANAAESHPSPDENASIAPPSPSDQSASVPQATAFLRAKRAEGARSAATASAEGARQRAEGGF